MRAINKIVIGEIRSNAGPLVAVALLMLATVAFDLIQPWPFKLLIDDVLSSAGAVESGSFFAWLHHYFPTRDLLGFFAVFVYFASSFTLAIVEYMKGVFTKHVIRSLTAQFSKAAFKNLETLAIGFYSKQKIGDYIYRLGYDVSALGEFLEEGILPLITSGIYLALTISIMLLIDVKLTLLSLSVLPFLTLGLYSFNKRVETATKRSEFWSSATYSFIEEALNHLKVIQAFTQEKKEAEKFDSRIDISLTKDVDMYKIDFMLSLLVGVVIALSYSTVIIYGIHGVFLGDLTTGLLIVFIFYLDNLTFPILDIIYAATAVRTSYTKISRMEEFFSQKSHLDYHEGHIKKIRPADIRFSHVSFLGDEGKKIIDNLSFTIEAGKRTVIFGASGSGKTTIANLLLRFIDKPSSGTVTIGSSPIAEYDIEALRHGIAYVPQEVTLFDDSIFHNIVLGARSHSLDRAKRAAKLADADAFIEHLPGKYGFRVGESGGFLSGGQRQRIMLARAFMKEDAPILIFDETFSALDVKTRKKVLDNVFEFSRGKTTILISNIFDVIGAADNIIVLSHGRLLYSGPAKRLPKEISLYNMIMESEPGTA